MRKPMRLRGRVKLENDRSFTFSSVMFDETPFDLTVSQYEIVVNDPFLASNNMIVDGYLLVTQESKQGERCALTLPQPSLQFGRQITVSEHQLLPLVSSLADFNPVTKTPPKTSSSEEVNDEVVSDS